MNRTLGNITLGKTYRDQISGFVGVAIGYVTYISGCNQVSLTPRVDAEGKRRDSEWFDEQRLFECDVTAIDLDNSNGAGCDSLPPNR